MTGCLSNVASFSIASLVSNFKPPNMNSLNRKAITTVNVVSVLDGNYLEADIKTDASENDEARMNAVASNAALPGILLEKMERRKNPDYNPTIDSSDLATIKMSEGTLDTSVVQHAFQDRDISVVLSDPASGNPLKETLDAQSKAMRSLKTDNDAIAQEKKESDQLNKVMKKDIDKMKKDADKMKKDLDKVKKDADKEAKDFQQQLDKYAGLLSGLEERFEEKFEKLAREKEEENQRYNSEIEKLSDKITSQQRTIDAINRRDILNDARKEAFDRLVKAKPQVNPWTCPETDLINDLHSILHDAKHSLAKDAIRLFVLRSSTIREQGNLAPHEATIHDIGPSILAMPEGKERKHITQIYQLLYEREPVF